MTISVQLMTPWQQRILINIVILTKIIRFFIEATQIVDATLFWYTGHQIHSVTVTSSNLATTGNPNGSQTIKINKLQKFYQGHTGGSLVHSALLKYFRTFLAGMDGQTYPPYWEGNSNPQGMSCHHSPLSLQDSNICSERKKDFYSTLDRTYVQLLITYLWSFIRFFYPLSKTFQSLQLPDQTSTCCTSTTSGNRQTLHKSRKTFHKNIYFNVCKPCLPCWTIKALLLSCQIVVSPSFTR